MEDIDGVGIRTARARKLAGFTQRQLAGRANVSVSLLQKVERGDRPGSPAFTTAVARALGLSPADLYGQPFQLAGRMEAVAVDELRRALVEFDDGEASSAPLRDIEARLATVTSLYRRTRYTEVAALLPDIVRQLHSAIEAEHTDDGRDRAYRLLAEAYGKAMVTAKSLGYLDLAALAAERCRWAAQRSDDPLMVAIGDYHRAMILLYSGAYTTGLKIVERAQDRMERRRDDAASLTVRGTLHLRGAILAARAGDRDIAEAHFHEAQTCVGLLDRVEPTDPYGTAFNRDDVTIHAAAVPLELMDAPTAIRRATDAHLSPGVPASRVGHHHIDMARAWLLLGNRDRALASLRHARQIAHELTRYHPQVHETVRALVRAERRRSDKLASFARWAGVKI